MVNFKHPEAYRQVSLCFAEGQHLYLKCRISFSDHTLISFSSFAFCYRMGPVENPRTINLIQWTMQLVALILIYLSSYHQVASFSLVMAILVWSSVPDKWKTQVQVQYHRKFVKPKVRLLSEQEYLDQSRVETEKALRELRDYCQVWSLTQFFLLPIF